MNYHTLAANEDDGDINSSNLNNPLEHKSRANLQNNKDTVKPRNPLRRSLSAQHRAIKVRLSLFQFYIQWTKYYDIMII